MSARRSLHSARGAFTLIELIVAMAGCAIILSAIYGVFSRAVKLRDSATERTREARVQSHALGILRRDLRGIWISGGTFAATFDGSQEAHSGGLPGYLRFFTTAAPDDGESLTGDLQEVEYYVSTDPEATERKAGRLVRTVNRDLLAPVRSTPPEEPLLRGVESMEVSFFDGETWQSSWSYTTAGDPLPQAVRVRLQISGAAMPTELIVPWVAQPQQ